MRCSYTVFYVYLRRVSRNWGNFFSARPFFKNLHSTCAVLKDLSQFRDNFLNIKKCITTFHFYAMTWDQKYWLSYLSISTLSNVEYILECMKSVMICTQWLLYLFLQT